MKAKYSLALLGLLAAGTVHADLAFGRFYTTPGQREQLDAARSRQPQEIIVVPVSEEALPATSGDNVSPISSSSITLDGIVYRSDGKNTAWINRNSTNEGNIETQFTKVDEQDVGSNQVRITLPDNQTRIELKVGQQYDVNTRQVLDIGQDNRLLTSPVESAESKQQKR